MALIVVFASFFVVNIQTIYSSYFIEKKRFFFLNLSYLEPGNTEVYTGRLYFCDRLVLFAQRLHDEIFSAGGVSSVVDRRPRQSVRTRT